MRNSFACRVVKRWNRFLLAVSSAQDQCAFKNLLSFTNNFSPYILWSFGLRSLPDRISDTHKSDFEMALADVRKQIIAKNAKSTIAFVIGDRGTSRDKIAAVVRQLNMGTDKVRRRFFVCAPRSTFCATRPVAMVKLLTASSLISFNCPIHSFYV